MCRASKNVTWKNYKQHRREKLHIMLLKKEVVKFDQFVYCEICVFITFTRL